MMNDVVKFAQRAIDDYYKQHNKYPFRITVSQEIARELDAQIAANNEKFSADLVESPTLVATGHAMWLRGVLVVADLDDKHIVDIRNSEHGDLFWSDGRGGLINSEVEPDGRKDRLGH